MKFSATKFILNFVMAIAAIAVGVLAVTGRIHELWIIPAILTAGFAVVRAWFLTIPFGKKKEDEALERVKTRLDNQYSEV